MTGKRHLPLQKVLPSWGGEGRGVFGFVGFVGLVDGVFFNSREGMRMKVIFEEHKSM